MFSNSTLNLVFCYACAVVFLSSMYRWVVFHFYENRNRVWAGVQPGLMGYQRGKLRYIKNCREVIAQGLEMYGNRLFWVPTLIGPMAIVPPAQINEVKNHPNLSFAAYFYDAMAGHYTDAHKPFQMPTLFNLVKKNLTKSSSLNHLTMILSEETHLAMDDYFPATEEWTSLPLYQQLVTSIARVSARVFVGTSLCRNSEWLDLTSKFIVNVLTAGMAMRNFPSFTHPIIKYAIPQIYRVQKTYPRARKLISEVVAARRIQQEFLGDKYEKPIDALQWAMDMGEPDESLAELQLTLGGTAVHTTGAALTHMLYDLCENPWIIPELRQEIEEVMEEGNIPGVPCNLHKLRLLDSFMKESQRMNPIQSLIMQRKSTAAITLSNGCVIPSHSYLSVPLIHVLNNPSIYQNPTQFDPYRFLRLRETPGEERAHQFSSISEKFFAFGLGAHACPGRFFAGNEIKVLLVAILTRYDFRFPQGEGSTGRRPKNLSFEEQNAPCLTQEIEFRRRSAKS